MRQDSTEISVSTQGKSLTDITRQARGFVADSGITSGLFTAFCRHTTASLLIQENADPDVRRDLMDAFAGLAPEGAGYRHETEGPDDMPGHIKAALSQASLSIPVAGCALALGTWQALYLAEWRAAPHTRKIAFHVIGD